MTPGTLEQLATELRRERMLEAERERLAGGLRARRVRASLPGRTAATLGQLLATHREAAAR